MRLRTQNKMHHHTIIPIIAQYKANNTRGTIDTSLIIYVFNNMCVSHSTGIFSIRCSLTIIDLSVIVSSPVEARSRAQLHMPIQIIHPSGIPNHKYILPIRIYDYFINYF
jgi:hypothetical protein